MSFSFVLFRSNFFIFNVIQFWEHSVVLFHKRLCNVDSDLLEVGHLSAYVNHNQVRDRVANADLQFRMVSECRATKSTPSKPTITILQNFLLNFIMDAFRLDSVVPWHSEFVKSFLPHLTGSTLGEWEYYSCRPLEFSRGP